MTHGTYQPSQRTTGFHIRGIMPDPRILALPFPLPHSNSMFPPIHLK